MKKLLFILAAVLAGALLFVWQDPQLSKKVKDQTHDLLTPTTTTVYKWQDAKGNWQISNSPPASNIPYETQEYHRDTNIMPSEIEKKAKR